MHGALLSFIWANFYLGLLKEEEVKVKKRARSDSESEDLDTKVCMEDHFLLFVLTLT
jgi:preprotein translocase subunit SecG